MKKRTRLSPACPPDQKDATVTLTRERTTNGYFPALEKVLKGLGQDCLVGRGLNRSHDHQLNCVEELDPSLLARISSLPTVKKFLQPGSQRKHALAEKSLEEAKMLRFK